MTATRGLLEWTHVPEPRPDTLRKNAVTPATDCPSIDPGRKRIQRAYVRVLLFLLGRGLQAASRVDPDLKREIAGLPDGFRFMLTVFPRGPRLGMGKDRAGLLRYRGSRMREEEADVVVMMKNIEAAMLLLTFREGTAVSFARGRMITRGDLSINMALVRCLNIVQAYLLPERIARKALKRYPAWPPLRKLLNRIRIFIRILFGR